MSKSVFDDISKERLYEINAKKVAVDHAAIEDKHRQLEERNRELEELDSFDIAAHNQAYVLALSEETGDYLIRARKSKVFLNNDFRGKIPFFSRNIILAAAETGSGKSTLSANLTYQALLQGQRVLVISNEENAGDIYNRITCLLNGWSYSDHGKFTDEQILAFKTNIIKLSQRLTVISDSYNGKTGCTTTIEGVENLCNSLIRKNTEFDLIIFDYYQNIDRSVKSPNLSEFQVQYRFCKFLDQYKNRSNAALLVLSQKKPQIKDKELPFRETIEGRKSILNVATCALNVVKDVENYCTLFTIMKSRFNDSIGQTIKVGFKRGEYVPFTNEFKLEALTLRTAREQAAVMEKVNPGGRNGA